MEPQVLNQLLELNFSEFFNYRQSIYDSVDTVLTDYRDLLSSELLELLSNFKNEFFELYENKILKLQKDLIVFKMAKEQNSLDENQMNEEINNLVSLQKHIIEQSNYLVDTMNNKIITLLNQFDIDNENFTGLVKTLIASFENLVNDTYDLILKLNRIE